MIGWSFVSPGRSRNLWGSKCLNVPTTRDRQLARTRYDCASTNSSWTRPTRACFAMEPLSLSPQHPSQCCALSRGSQARSSRPTHCSMRYGDTSSSPTLSLERRSASCGQRSTMTRANRASSRPCRGAVIDSLRSPTQSSTRRLPRLPKAVRRDPHRLSGAPTHFRDYVPTGISPAQVSAKSCGLPVNPESARRR